jgi:hypothetical protein
MSVGSPKIVVRLPGGLREVVDLEVIRRNKGRTGKPYTVSDLIRSAVSEKMKHVARGRKSRRVRGVKEVESELERDRQPE